MKIYILGDILKGGSQLLRAKEAEELRSRGLDVYSAIEDKEINDKSNQTEDSNNGLAEKIVFKDTQAIRASDVIIAEVDNDSVGSCVEIGQIDIMNQYHTELCDIIKNSQNEKEVCDKLNKFLLQNPYKEVYCHNGDMRRTSISEVGDRRSWSINQYLYGVVLRITKNRGIEKFKDILDRLA